MENLLPQELIEHRIYVFRGKRVMMDRDLAKLYGVETKNLKRAVQRNFDRFPSDFMFELTDQEFEDWRCQFVTSKSDRQGLRRKPLVFTEQGIAMLSGVLKSKRAVAVNILIMRAFVYLRETTIDINALRLKIETLEKNCDEQFRIVFDALRQIMIDESEKPPIGF